MVGDIDEHTSLVGADLVEEDGGVVSQADETVFRVGERAVDEFHAPEFGASGGLVGGEGFAELGGVAVADDSEVGEEEVFICFAG